MDDIPFKSIEFLDSWRDWEEYKFLEFKFKYKSKHSVKAALKKLYRLSEGNEKKAIEIIEESMANGWKGLFALKDQVKKENSKRNAAELLKEKHGLS